MRIAFFGSSLVSAYWNGAATYYRGLIKALHRQGHFVTFFEPDAYQRQKHRDLEEVPYAEDVVYPPKLPAVKTCLCRAKNFDVVIKASGIGVFDDILEAEVLGLKSPDRRVYFLDVDAPATLERVKANAQDAFRPLIGQYDAILTYGGGSPVVESYIALGATRCVPIYNALDPETHYPVEAQDRFQSDLSFLGNRMPDREERVREFFFKAAKQLPNRSFLLGGSGWEYEKQLLPNIRYVGHVYTGDHNAFNCSAAAVLNISRQSMADYGFSPATRVFEAAGAGACVITDKWKGLEMFLEDERQCLVVSDGEQLARVLADLTPQRARQIGQAARDRILEEHTYDHRALLLEEVFLTDEQSLSAQEMLAAAPIKTTSAGPMSAVSS